MVTGDITNPSDLREAQRKGPDAVTINYILHDIAGQASTYEQGLERVTEFLRSYRGVFGKKRLYITESWDVSWEALRASGRSYMTLYTWLHGISPQRLLPKATFSKTAGRGRLYPSGCHSHGRMLIDGVRQPINETIVVAARCRLSAGGAPLRAQALRSDRFRCESVGGWSACRPGNPVEVRG